MFYVILVFASNANTLESEDGEQFPPYLFLSVENAKDIQVKQNPTIVRSRLVNVDFSLLPDLGKNFTAELGGEIRLILNAFQGTEFTVLIQKIIKKRSGSYAWYGILKDFPLSRVTLVLNKNTVFGSISKAGFFYQIRPVSDGIHVVYEIDPSKFPPTSEPITPNTGSRFPSNNFSFPYLYDESQEVAKKYSAVCTPDFFGYNKNSELQYRGRILEAKKLKPIHTGDTELRKAMKLIAETGKGPHEQFPSMGCSIKWFK